MASSTTVKVALDWTPNTIHSGLFCALQKKLYQDQGLDVQLLPPDANYSTTPAKRLENGEVDLAICPSESCIAYNENGKMKLQAIYAILQKDASAIVSTKHQNIKDLEGRVYGSYNAKYEDHIVKAMVDAAGGKGEKVQTKGSTGKLSLFEEVRKGDLDATWVFMPWEGVEAELDGIPLYAFRPEDHGVPYGYSPVIAHNASASLSKEVLKKFTAATAKGYEYAMRDAIEAAAILAPHCRPERSQQFLVTSQERINGYYSDGGSALGYMRSGKWEAWIGWLKEKELLKKDLDAGDLYSNEFSSS